MIEVFKTDIEDRQLADKLVGNIHQTFIGYKANFDLEDCDHILRVKSVTGSLESSRLIYFLRELGCNAEILPDEIKELVAQEICNPGDVQHA